MRFALASSLLALFVACGSFGSDGARDPAAPVDASADVAVTSSSSSSSGGSSSGTSSSGGVPDAGFVCPDAAFCDDFTRADTSDVRGVWTALEYHPGDPAPAIEDGAFHLFAAEATAGMTRTYLRRDLRAACEGAMIVVDFDFKLGTTSRTSNLAVITVDAGDVAHYASLATAPGSIVLGSSNAANAGYFAQLALAAGPSPGVWTHAQLAVDGRVNPPRISAKINGAPIGGGDGSNLEGGVTSCRLSIGNDFIGPGTPADRWYDNVVADVSF